ncbi:MAG: S9 family peptidase [Bacteroidaceae bacterium]|nr:S9 family peptidase [Bacteroidaceae bacterium]
MLQKRLFPLLALACLPALSELKASTDTLAVKQFRHVGPIALRTPVLMDSTDVAGKKFDAQSLLQTPLRLDAVKDGALVDADGALILTAAPSQQAALHLAAFGLNNASLTKATVTVQGAKQHELYLDGTRIQSGQATTLQPATHQLVVKVLVSENGSDTLRVSVSADAGRLSLTSADAPSRYTMSHVLHARRNSGVSLSPNGDYAIVSSSQTRPGGETSRTTELRSVRTWQVLEQRADIRWMPRSNRYYFTRTSAVNGRELVSVDPQTRAEQVLATQLPEGQFTFTPDETRLVFQLTDEGQQEKDADVFEVVEPDDRQPGWRTRSHLAIYDLRTGLMQPLTFGHSSVWMASVAQDSRHALLMASRQRLTQRPTTLFSLYRLDLSTLAVDTLVVDDGFMTGAMFSPDGRQVLLVGSPEAFGGIGMNVRQGQTPSMIDYQLYVMDIATRSIQPLTKNFNPAIQDADWSTADGRIYFRAEDKDCIRLFCLDPHTRAITPVPVPEDVVLRFTLADKAPVMLCCGQGASNSDRLYTVQLADKVARSKVQLVQDLSAENLRGVQLGQCLPFTYVNPQGDSIYCRYYLPPSFDATRQYPMVVNYYGGCSPTSRHFESRYPQHAYAALGYVVLVVNPRGATGFGQEWSAQHVNTAGQGVAEDIIGAVKAFTSEHAFVNAKKIGCIGASYGGFMTQYLQTQTDLFAAAISHAGISDHTSYWGEGFWGYSYSEVSMANSYPWTDRKLYVDQSPLYNAAKIHTPLLFLHGTADNNVPVGESIQMYTALKLLGRPTAMVLVKGEDHHIQAYQKRLRWQDTIFAWFARWLQDDPTWWDEMYPDKAL